MKGLFLFLLFFSHVMLSHAGNTTCYSEVDSSVVYRFCPEINEKEYNRKRTLFTDSLCVDFVLPHRKELLNMQDSVMVDFNVNVKGHVDSVWLEKPITQPFPYDCLYKYIKSYDFKGSLVEDFATVTKRYACTVRLLLILDRQSRVLHMDFDYIHIKEE